MLHPTPCANLSMHAIMISKREIICDLIKLSTLMMCNRLNSDINK